MPVLVRLDEELAPLRSCVNREGRVLRVSGSEIPDDLSATVSRILDQLGYVAEPLEEAPHVPRWFGADEIDALSHEEAQVLAERWCHELRNEGIIERPERLMEPLQATLLEAFVEAARSGSIDMVDIKPTEIRKILDEADTERVLRWIRNKRLPGSD